MKDTKEVSDNWIDVTGTNVTQVRIQNLSDVYPVWLLGTTDATAPDEGETAGVVQLDPNILSTESLEVLWGTGAVRLWAKLGPHVPRGRVVGVSVAY
jgi:hypothetical protein